MLEQKNEGLVRGTRVVTDWSYVNGKQVLRPKPGPSDVVDLGVECIILGRKHGMLRAFGFLPDGCELPAGWYVVRAKRDLNRWHKFWGDYLEGREAGQGGEG
jgi:hypothetical protein